VGLGYLLGARCRTGTGSDEERMSGTRPVPAPGQTPGPWTFRAGDREVRRGPCYPGFLELAACRAEKFTSGLYHGEAFVSLMVRSTVPGLIPAVVSVQAPRGRCGKGAEENAG
jgi:hypothetical protein